MRAKVTHSRLFSSIGQRFPDVRVAQRLPAEFERRSENPILGGRELSYLLPLLQHFEQFVGTDHGACRIPRFHVINDLLHYSTFKLDCFSEPVNILPL